MSNRSLSRQAIEAAGYQLQADGSYAKAGSKPAAPMPVIAAAKAVAAKPQKKKQGKSPLSARFEAEWAALKGPLLVPEHRFHKTRKWRFDFACPRAMIGIELDGGIFNGGRHNRASGFKGDCEKFNAAASDGWRIFRLATGMVTTAAVQQIIDAIRKSEP